MKLKNNKKQFPSLSDQLEVLCKRKINRDIYKSEFELVPKPTISLQQTDNNDTKSSVENLSENLTQTSLKPHSNLTHNLTQKHKGLSPDNYVPSIKNLTQNLTQIPNLTQTSLKPDSNLTQNLTRNLTRNLTQDKPLLNIQKLRGYQRQILNFLFDSCKNSATLIIDVPSSVLTDLLECNIACARLAIIRLIDKGFLKKLGWKDGPGGSTTYEINEYAYKEMIKSTLKPNSKPDSKPDSNGLHSNNTFKNKKERTIIMTFDDLPEDWQNIDLMPMSEFKLGRSSIVDIFEKGQSLGATPEMVQDAICVIPHIIKNNKTGSLNPIALLVGRLSKGRPIDHPPNYKSQDEIDREVWIKKMAARDELRHKQVEEVCDLAYRNWIFESKEEELFKIPWLKSDKNGKFNLEVPSNQLALKNYFVENIWPDVKNKKELGFL